jgi:AcrR family transcriptional regulator
MAYEVTKLVNGRPYRYSVRSERDPDTGKTRNRWTYLGRGERGDPPATTRPRPNAREALLDALERLLDRSDLSDVTAGAVSREAGLAHGTFYRYFRNRDDAIRALTARLREAMADELGLLDDPPPDKTTARAALCAWTALVLRTRTRHHGLVRALYALATADEAIRNALRTRRNANSLRLTTWLSALAERGILTLPEPAATGDVLFSMLDGVGRDAIAAGEPLAEWRGDAAAELVARAVFGDAP